LSPKHGTIIVCISSARKKYNERENKGLREWKTADVTGHLLTHARGVGCRVTSIRKVQASADMDKCIKTWGKTWDKYMLGVMLCCIVSSSFAEDFPSLPIHQSAFSH
jgi:hypothetical protein